MFCSILYIATSLNFNSFKKLLTQEPQTKSETSSSQRKEIVIVPATLIEVEAKVVQVFQKAKIAGPKDAKSFNQLIKTLAAGKTEAKKGGDDMVELYANFWKCAPASNLSRDMMRAAAKFDGYVFPNLPQRLKQKEAKKTFAQAAAPSASSSASGMNPPPRKVLTTDDVVTALLSTLIGYKEAREENSSRYQQQQEELSQVKSPNLEKWQAATLLCQQQLAKAGLPKEHSAEFDLGALKHLQSANAGIFVHVLAQSQSVKKSTSTTLSKSQMIEQLKAKLSAGQSASAQPSAKAESPSSSSDNEEASAAEDEESETESLIISDDESETVAPSSSSKAASSADHAKRAITTRKSGSHKSGTTS